MGAIGVSKQKLEMEEKAPKERVRVRGKSNLKGNFGIAISITQPIPNLNVKSPIPIDKMGWLVGYL